jgi:DtxR family Mn-dependent transcriptional regulator
MVPSSTVENYLKAIYQGQLALLADDRLVSMGQVALSLGVTPGTATTMVKALAESGLVDYEPYSGVRLSAAGEKLAGLVLRRHRLVELFLVQVMGMSWAEVHDEAEQLEHVVSERLIERIDDMLGRPTHDPHGDPIPTPEGAIPSHHFESLLTCPVGAPLRVARIADQDPAFLRFIERNHLKPGEAIEVDTRDDAADAVTVRGKNRAPIVIGARAASKLLVEIVTLVVMLLLASGLPARAQTTTSPTPSSSAAEPFAITDNSFLVEEAFNQDPGVVQNIFGWTRGESGGWLGSFVQEWPLGGMKHQISYSLPFSGGDSAVTHLDSVLINYRFQVMEEGSGHPAFSPRLSLMLPTGRHSAPDHHPGFQTNLPFSKQAGDLYFHGNAGLTWTHGVELGNGARTNLTSPFLAASAIWRTTKMFHLMLESTLAWNDSILDAGDKGRVRTWTLLPGFRRGWNFGERQVVVGLGMPITGSSEDTTLGVLTYFSYELPFRKP